MVILTACASAFDAGFRRIPPQESLIRVEHPAFERNRAVYSVGRDPAAGGAWYVSEVNGRQAFGVAVASRLEAGHEAVQRPTEEWVRTIIAPDYRIAWSASREAPTSSPPVPYRLFRMGDADGPAFACVAFSERRGPLSEGGEPRDILFGYFCRSGDRPLDPALAEEMVASLELDPST